MNDATIRSPVSRLDLEVLASTALRVGLGVVMVAHGWQKAVDFAAWEHQVAALGLPMPEIAARLAVGCELGGGVLLILGMLTSLAGVAVAAAMAVAIGTVHAGHGIFARNGGWELPLLLGLAALYCAARGSGPIGIDALVASKPREASRRMAFPIGRATPAASRI